MSRKLQPLPEYQALVRWSVQEVVNWLSQNGMNDCMKSFRHGGVDGNKLVNVTVTDLNTINCPKRHIRDIMQLVSQVPKPGMKMNRGGGGWRQPAQRVPPNEQTFGDAYPSSRTAPAQSYEGSASGSEDEAMWDDDEFDNDYGITTLKNNDSVRVIISETANAAIATNRTRVTRPPPGTQIGQAQIDKILVALSKNGNFLVWGLGNDSPFWHDCTDGKVVFLEERGTPWFTKITNKYPFLEAYEVKYSTHVTRSFERYKSHMELWYELDLRPQLPPHVVSTKWDVILVDAPAGYTTGSPGRYESILTSILLARIGTHIFVDDYNRKVEHEMSDQMLGIPVEITERPPKPAVEPNKQAHFIINEWHVQNITNRILR